MLDNIKKELLSNPEKIREALEHFGYCHVVIRNTYMSFGRDEVSSKKSIVINLKNNKALFVHDYARAIQKDLFSYIMQQRGVDFAEVLGVVKNILGITDYYDFFDRQGIFGGFYERIRNHNVVRIQTYDESILDKYNNVGNLRFLKDNISLEAQRTFGIRFDTSSQGIAIPIRNQLGQLIGVKERFNHDVEDGEMKYFYDVPCQMSQTLYGYSQNYQYLANGVVLIFEAEKSVMQCFTYGIRNCVALGSGTISKKQVQLLLELNPKKVIFMHDVGYDIKNIMRNIDMVKGYSRFAEIELGYWDFNLSEYSNKVSPSDMGKEKLNYILENEIKMIGDEDVEEEI